jgi:hypothetical protein
MASVVCQGYHLIMILIPLASAKYVAIYGETFLTVLIGSESKFYSSTETAHMLILWAGNMFMTTSSLTYACSQIALLA